MHEWNSGKLRYYTHPPEDASTQKPETAVSAEIVSQFSKEFDIDSLDEDLRQIVEDSSTVVTSGRHKKTGNDDDESEQQPLPTSLVIDGNVQLNRAIKKVLKKNKRAAKKQEKRTEKLADAMDITSI
ncbi:unnamed protein product [Heligmosomoides polygyrus]|uniref:Uncharacterized protein n=1 Tax=Heligmosomoides polygyrus TaxID=6339 RepID=A0A3P8AKN4_HELPZ|nr:unnamed protein product [Heligmosomoides polygyrus]